MAAIRTVIFIFICMQACAFPARAECSGQLSIAYSDWSREGTKNSQGEKDYGMDFELLKSILEIAECPFNHRPVPFKRIQEAIKHGTIDGTMGASLTVPRQEYAWFTAPYRQEIMAMFMLKEEVNKFAPKQFEDIATSGYRVGLGIGSWHGAKMANLIASNPDFRKRVLYIDDFSIMYQWLQHGRVDIAVNDIHYGYFTLRKKNLQDLIVPHPFYINTNDVHIMLSKKSVSNKDAAIISDAVERFRGTKEYHDILQRYSPMNTPPNTPQWH